MGLYPDGRPGELFITMAKEGSTIGGLMDCFGTAVSMSLQYGVPLEVYVNKFSHTRFEPMGFTKHPDIKIAKSLVDYIFRWLGITFLPGFREANKMVPPSPVDPRASRAGRHGNRALARRHDGRRAERGPRIGQARQLAHGSLAFGRGAGGEGRRQRHGQRTQRRRSEARREAQRHLGRRGRDGSRVGGRACRAPELPGPGLASFPAASSSPRSRPTPRRATTAARSPSATATATSAITAGAVWGVREEENP